MNIIYSVNNKYGHYLFNSVLSLLSNTKRRDINLYILYSELSDEFTAKFLHFFERFGITINFVYINEQHLGSSEYKVNDRIAIEAYYRIFIGEIISPQEQRALYLDCDTLLNFPIEEFYFQSLQGNTIAAVEDIIRFHADFHNFVRNLELKKEDYFNSGVLLIDLIKWRETNVFERSLHFLENNLEKIVYHDQDILNAVLNENWLNLNFNYNLQSHFVMHMSRYQSSFNNPKIIHYLGYKPDEEKCIHPLKDYFFVYDNFLKAKGIL